LQTSFMDDPFRNLLHHPAGNVLDPLYSS